MSSGLPIISTRVGGTPRLVGQKGAPLLFNSGDKEALAKNLLLLLSNKDLQQDYGSAMRDRIINDFDIEAVAKRYHMVYQYLTNPFPGRSVSDFSSPIFKEIL
jgi:glycosyltransferase involved in cell wall biosynthesis